MHARGTVLSYDAGGSVPLGFLGPHFLFPLLFHLPRTAHSILVRPPLACFPVPNLFFPSASAAEGTAGAYPLCVGERAVEERRECAFVISVRSSLSLSTLHLLVLRTVFFFFFPTFPFPYPFFNKHSRFSSAQFPPPQLPHTHTHTTLSRSSRNRQAIRIGTVHVCTTDSRYLSIAFPSKDTFRSFAV